MIPTTFSLLLIPLFFAGFDNSWQNVFCEIEIFGISGNLECDQIKDKLTFKEGNNITMSLNSTDDSLTINASGGNQPNELYCDIGKWFNAFNGTTSNFICETVPTGAVYENNTASNIGLGYGLFKQKTGVNLEFLNIFCAGDINCSSNATDVRISATIPDAIVYENNTQSSPTHANTLVLAKSGVDLPIKGIACTGTATCSNNSTDVTINVSAGSGEANTQSSPTHANTLVLTKSGVDLPIKGIACSNGINCTVNSTDVTINLLDEDKTDITVSSTGNVFTIDNDVVTYDKMQNIVSDDVFLGRISGANGNTEELTPTQATSLLNVFTSVLKGLVPASGGGTTTFLRADGTFAAPPTGSGIPMPPKKWGELIPRTSSTDLLGLVAGCTILGTATYVYDTTDNSNAILSTTAITDGINGGIHCTGTDYHSFRGDQNAYLYAKWEENKITTNRIFIGFSSSATHLPNNADTILDNLSGVGLCIRTTDTVYQMCRNDGDATTDYATLTTSEDTGVHYVEVYTTDAGVTWSVKLDGGTAVSHTTELPATTTRMYAMSTGETDGGASAILWTQYLFYVQSDK